MPRSGAKINKAVPDKYQDFKMSKNKIIKWQIYRVMKEEIENEDGTKTQTDNMEWNFFNEGKCITELKDAVPTNDCACIFADISDSMKDGTTKYKITCIQWNPDNAPIGLKMKFASSVDQLKAALDFTGKSLQLSDSEDLLDGNLKKEALAQYK